METNTITPELDALIERVERHQKHLRLGDARFVARYQKQLKSADTWVRTLKGRDATRLTERNQDKWLGNLRELVAEIEDAAGGESVYNLPIMAECISLYDRLHGVRGDTRVGWLIGTTGVGKSVSLRFLHKQNPQTTAYLIIPELWRNSRMALTRGLAAALGTGVDTSANETFERVVAKLSVAPMTLLVDEFHEGGVLLVKLIKTLIERTPTRFILTTWPNGYNTLASGPEGCGETRQLVGRSLRPICRQWRAGVQTEDVAEYLANAVPGLEREDIAQLAREFVAKAKLWGFRLLSQTVAQAATRADVEDAALTPDLLREVFFALSRSVNNEE